MARRRPRLPPDTDIVAFLAGLSPEKRAAAVAMLGPMERDSLDRAWPDWAHGGQLPPPGDWSAWVLMAGRGFGKTLAGAKWITAAIAARAPLRIALVGATLDDARRVMVEGPSGLIAVAGDWVKAWNPSLRRLSFTTGAEATLFSGASPDALRGPEHHLAWCDELAKWEKARESWEMLQLGLRLGQRPRALVTTTPRPGPVLRAIMAEPGTVVTGGRTQSNPHLPKAYKKRVEALYAGTRLGRQELDGELLTDSPGQLWTVDLIERCRLRLPLPLAGEGKGEGLFLSAPGPGDSHPPASGRRGYVRLVIAVDPPSGGGTCGIVACARDSQGIAHVLADHSVTGRSPDGWARAVADAAALWRSLIPSLSRGAGVEILAESNQGGEMVKTILLSADPGLNVRLATAHKGKTVRAEPVAQLFEAGRVVLHGRMEALEKELLGMIAGADYEAAWAAGDGPRGKSPDRADAMVWALTELMLRKKRAAPRVIGL